MSHLLGGGGDVDADGVLPLIVVLADGHLGVAVAGLVDLLALKVEHVPLLVLRVVEVLATICQKAVVVIASAVLSTAYGTGEVGVHAKGVEGVQEVEL